MAQEQPGSEVMPSMRLCSAVALLRIDGITRIADESHE